MGLADLHIHTIFSKDGTASVPTVLKRAKEAGLDIIAITDHDSIRGALLAVELAPQFGIQVIPGVEISTAEGDVLALSVGKLIPAGLSLIETAIRVGELGGFCIAPHPTAMGLGMNSLSAYSIREALRDREASRVLIGIETYNATVLDRESNDAARILAERSDVAQTGGSDAHISEVIGFGATIFPGNTIQHLIAALWTATTRIRTGPQWGSAHILSNWAASYLMSTPYRLYPALGTLPGESAQIEEVLPV
jgi:predicted metal-dependent phosphoesterase TrpH